MIRLDGLGGIEYVERFRRPTFSAFSGTAEVGSDSRDS